MPRVQAYRSSAEVAPLRVPRVRPTGGEGLAEVAQGAQEAGQALQRAGSALAQGVQRERERATDIAVLDTTSGLQSFLTTTLEEAGNERGEGAGFLRKKGRAAFEAEAPTWEAIEKKRQQLGTGLPTEESRQRYERDSRRMVDAARGRMESHLAQQGEAAAELTLKTTVESAKQALSYGYADAETRAVQLDNVQRAVRARYAHAPPEERATLEAAALADVHTDVVERYLDAGDTAGAAAYFGTHKQALGKAVGPLQARMRKEEEALAAEGEALEIVRSYTTPEGRPDLTAIQARVDKVAEKRRPEVRERAERLATQATTAWNRKVDGVFDRAASGYLRAGRNLAGVAPKDKAWLQQHAPMEWDKLEELRNRDRDRAKAQREGTQRTAPPTAEEMVSYGQVQSDMASSPERYASMTVESFSREWMSRLHPQDFQRALTKLADAHKAPDDRERTFQLQTPFSIVLQEGRAAKVFPRDDGPIVKINDPGTWNEERRNVWNWVARQVEERVTEWQNGPEGKKHKGPVPSEVVRKLAAELFTKVQVEGTAPSVLGVRLGEDRTMSTAQAEATGVGAQAYPALSEDELTELAAKRTQVEAAVRAKGQAPTEKNVRDTFLNWKRGQTRRPTAGNLDVTQPAATPAAPAPPPPSASYP